MNPQNREEDLHRREQELQERERSIRLRELEAELDQVPHYQTVKHQEKRGSVQRGLKQLAAFAKFLVVVVAVAVAFRIATRLAGIVIVVALAWVAYKLFFESDRSDA